MASVGLLHQRNIVIIQSATFCVVNTELNESRRRECYGFTNFHPWLNYISRKICRLRHVTGKVLSQSGHAIQRSVVACVMVS